MSGAEAELRRLLDIMAALRTPGSGCPWDVAQSFDTIAPYTIEEAYEVADAIARRDFAALPDELGDLLFQVVYHARMAEEAGRFAFADVARAIADKMVRRHPHVFGDAAARDAAAQTAAWEEQKRAERAARAETGALAGVAVGLPALTRAHKLTARAARVGFDWPDAATVLDKLAEETAELRAELGEADPARLADELGDMLIVLANLARKLGLDPEACLRGANDKFARRFDAMERRLAGRGLALADTDLATMDSAWTEVKRMERLAIRQDDLSGAPTRALLALHLAGMHANSPPGHVFALDLSGLTTPDVTVWTAWHGPEIAGIGALKALGDGSGEIKSMRTHPDHLRRGVAAALLLHVMAEARRRGLARLSLETGRGPAFEPALALYRAHGFRDGGAFAGYAQSAFNQFLHLSL